MKTWLRLFLLGLGFAGVGSAAETLPPGPADASYTALAAFQAEVLQGPASEIKGDAAAFRAWAIKHQGKLLVMRYEFACRYPGDSRHWQPLLEAAWTGVNNPKLLQAYEEKYPEASDEIEALRTWAAPALGALETDAAVPADIVTQLRFRRCAVALGEIEGAPQPDWKKVAAMLDDIAQRAPDFSRTYLEQRLAKLVYPIDAAAAEARLHRLIDDPKTYDNLRKMAQNELAAHAALTKPVELSFTAVDGRAVDLTQWRGKVVLVDFWATWCGPCVAELPNVKRVYEAYHDKGFEVVGISLDRPNDKQKLIDFVAKQKMPWPQYFDGGYWHSAPAVRYAINAIPAMFLLDQDGRIVSTETRGEKLEAEVKRLLKL